jgi:hypothetical protein
MVRVGVHPPVPALRVAQRKHVEYELADDLGRIQPGQAGGNPVEHDNAAEFVGDYHSVRKLIGGNQAPDWDRAFGKRADTGNLTVSSIPVYRRPGRLRDG